MGQITSQARRAGEIIRRLRALVGKQAPSRGAADLNHLVREVCSFVEFETGRLGVQIVLDLVPGEVQVEVDLVQIEQVLLNLLTNALDALEEVEAPERRLRIGTNLRGGEAEVRVEDTGPGITPEGLERLFEPFYTTKDTGMGMGLAISQTIVEDHGGRIWVESTLGQGTCFHLVLPLAATRKLSVVSSQ
jgi:signal transduction histidine kinase